MKVVEIRPQEGPQEHFLSSPADIAIYGGAAGGGKTWALLAEPLRYITVPGFGGVIFRRTYPEVTNEGGLWDEAMRIYPLLGAKPRLGDLSFVFNNSSISFGHLQLEQDKNRWQGSQICYLAFDELTHFSESQFFYMMSRNRSTCGVKPYIRATCNPDPESWVSRFIEWWIDPESGTAIPERGGILRWFVRSGDELVWADTAEELSEKYGGVIPRSVTFIPASVYDNKILMKLDPGYVSNLMSLPYVDRMQLLFGNWKVRAGAGKVFHRDWFEIVEYVPGSEAIAPVILPTGEEVEFNPSVPVKINSYRAPRPHLYGQNGKPHPTVPPLASAQEIVECRFWDFAATAKGTKNLDPDFTAGVKIRRVGTTYYVMDVVAGQWGTSELERILKQTVENDVAEAKRNRIPYRLRWEIEPGSAGIRENQRLVSQFAGIDAKGVRPGTGDKITRAKPFAVQCEVGNVKLKRGRWNENWLSHMHHQPDMPHDDIMDASVGSFEDLLQREIKVAKSRQG